MKRNASLALRCSRGANGRFSLSTAQGGAGINGVAFNEAWLKEGK